MADEPEIHEDLEQDLETPETEGDENESDAGENDNGGESEGEFSIEIDGEEAEDEAPLVKTLRQQIRDRDRELAEHRKANMPKIVVGEKPTLESCEYDEDRFESELVAWQDRKRQHDNLEADAAKAAEVRNQEFQRKAVNYKAKLAALPLPEEQKLSAEKLVIDTLPELLQSAIISYADDPAKVVVALAKYPQKLEQLAQEADPIRFILAMRDLERNLKVKRKSPGEPERETIQNGTAPQSQKRDKELEKLEKEAVRSGDRTKLIAYKKTLKAA